MVSHPESRCDVVADRLPKNMHSNPCIKGYIYVVKCYESFWNSHLHSNIQQGTHAKTLLFQPLHWPSKLLWIISRTLSWMTPSYTYWLIILWNQGSIEQSAASAVRQLSEQQTRISVICSNKHVVLDMNHQSKCIDNTILMFYISTLSNAPNLEIFNENHVLHGFRNVLPDTFFSSVLLRSFAVTTK